MKILIFILKLIGTIFLWLMIFAMMFDPSMRVVSIFFAVLMLTYYLLKGFIFNNRYVKKKEAEMLAKINSIEQNYQKVFTGLQETHARKILALEEETIARVNEIEQSNINELEKSHADYITKRKNAEMLNIDIEKELLNAKNRFDQIKDFNDIGDSFEELSKHNNNLVALVKEKKQELRKIEEIENLSDLGFYEKKYIFDNSRLYKTELDRIRNEQKIKIKTDEILRNYQIYFGVDNKKFINKIKAQIGKLMLRNFNTESDLCISNVTYRNFETMENRIRKSHETINKLGEMFGVEILYEYLQLKIEELILNYEYLEKQEQEKQEQRELLEQMREEEKAQREIERELAKTKKEEERYALALENARKDLELAHDEEKGDLLAKIALLEKNLLETQEKERAISQAQLTKAGHVYVISNIGSFGENVYKIGMTRRLEPEDRVNELGNASVPFPFDIHAMIFSDNAPELEKKLQREFDHLRLNKVNSRKEFFNVPIEEIEKKAIEHKGDVYFTKLAEAKQFRESLSLEKLEIN